MPCQKNNLLFVAWPKLRGSHCSSSHCSRDDLGWFARYLSRALAASVDDAGFCPVMRRPSVITKLSQSFAAFSYRPPCFFSSSSTKKGTTLVRCTASSSLLEKPVTCFPLTRGASW